MNTPTPTTDAPRPPADELIDQVKFAYHLITEQHLGPDERLVLYHGGPFGQLEVRRIFAETGNLIGVIGFDGEGQKFEILAPAGQCSFMLRTVKATPAQRRIVVGFGREEK